MKILYPVLLIFCLTVNSNLFGQDSLESHTSYYISISLGNGFESNTQPFYNYTETTDEVFFTTFGKGVIWEGFLGARLSPNINLELGINYLPGSAVNTVNKNIPDAERNRKFEFHPSALLYKPTIVFSFGNGYIIPYSKLSLIAAFINLDYKYEFDFGTSHVKEVVDFKGDITFGFSGSFGTNFKLNDRWMLFGELFYNSLTFKPTQIDLTEFKVNGVDHLDEVSKKTIMFSEKTRNNTSESLQEIFSYSSWGLKFGITYTL